MVAFLEQKPSLFIKMSQLWKNILLEPCFLCANTTHDYKILHNLALQLLLLIAEGVNPLSEDVRDLTTYYKNIADIIIIPFNLFSEDEGEVIIITFLREFSGDSLATSRIFVNAPLQIDCGSLLAIHCIWRLKLKNKCLLN